MKQTGHEAVAQGAAAWYEQQNHEQIMSALNKVRGYMQYCSCDYGHGYYWKVDKLSIEQLQKIMSRGHKDEILHMIHRYGQAASPQHFTQDCDVCHKTPTKDNILPDEIQRQIALRNDRDEVEAFLSYQGFCPMGQNVILDRNDHNEIMHYISLHGFASEQQRRLKARNNREEISLHILKHGLASELLDEMFDKIAQGGDLSEYYDFINLRELPVPYQKLMVKVVKTPEFKAYVNSYGLWEDAHDDLVKYRSEDDLAYYLRIHNYLKPSAAKVIAQEKSHALKMLYISVYPYPFTLNTFFSSLLESKDIDYEAISACVSKLNFTEERLMFCSYGEKTEAQDIELMQNGTTEDVLIRIKEKKLSLKALIYLFYRNIPEEFEMYVSRWVKKEICDDEPSYSSSSSSYESDSFSFDTGDLITASWEDTVR